MYRLAFVLYIMIATTIAGSLVVAALVSGLDTGKFIIWAAVAGAVIALPISFGIARKLRPQ